MDTVLQVDTVVRVDTVLRPDTLLDLDTIVVADSSTTLTPLGISITSEFEVDTTDWRNEPIRITFQASASAEARATAEAEVATAFVAVRSESGVDTLASTTSLSDTATATGEADSTYHWTVRVPVDTVTVHDTTWVYDTTFVYDTTWVYDTIYDTDTVYVYRPKEATDSVTGSGDDVVHFEMKEEGLFRCTGAIEDNGDPDNEEQESYFGVEYYDSEDEWDLWVSEITRDGEYSSVVRVPRDVAEGVGNLDVSAHDNSSWTVWCRKQ